MRGKGENLEVDRLRAELAILKKSRRAITQGLDKKIKSYILRNQQLAAALTFEVVGLQEHDKGSTHWEGCEREHPRCAAIKRMQAALAVGYCDP